MITLASGFRRIFMPWVESDVGPERPGDPVVTLASAFRRILYAMGCV